MDLTGRRAVVTGATSGIGLETAAGLAAAGAEVVLTGRDSGRGERALAELRRRHPAARVSFALADQADLGALAGFAAALLGDGRPLDLLVNNAGVMGMPRRETTADGFERQFGTNHLGHFALTARLVPALLRAEAPRVVTVSSLTHRRARLAFDNLQSERHYDRYAAYGRSKLANLLFALEFARRAEAARSRLVSIAAHPGFAATHLFSATLQARVGRVLAGIVGQSAAAGARPVLHAATAPGARNGGYYGPDGFGEMTGRPAAARIAPHAANLSTAERLWRESERLTGVRFPPLA